MQKDSAQKTAAFFGALLAWAAVVTQLVLMLQNRTASVSETLIRFCSFFTILTNTLAAVCYTAVVIKPGRRHGFFTKPATLSAVTVYILVVGLVYNGVLRALWKPEGLQQTVDELLHTVNPVYFLLFWILFVPKDAVTWSGVFRWLFYPLLYLVYVLLRGAASGFYPYPFVNVTDLGYAKVGLNAVVLLLAFLLLSFLLVGMGKLFSRKT